MRALNGVLIATTLATGSALQLAPRSISPRVVSLPIHRSNVDPQAAAVRDRARLRKRQDKTVDVTLDNTESLYFTNLTLGTPGQELRLHLDTGSSDLWVNVPDSSICRQGNCMGGTYNPDDSSSHNVINTNFNISYVDGSGATGDYVTDTLGFAGITIDSFQFGTGQTSTSAQGVLGIGYTRNEVQVNRNRQDPYPNLPQALKDAGHIASNAYSLWLNDLDASTGEILFGGVDSAKFSGELATIPLLQQYGTYYQFLIAMTGLTINGQQSSSNELPEAVLLDSGSTLTYLPQALAAEVFNQVDAVWVDNVGAAYASCELANTDRTIDFTFSGKTISVPFNELFLNPGTAPNGATLQLENGDPACIFGISQLDGHVAVLGDTFLRSAYVVYDLENNAISLAQTVYNATASDVREIANAGDDIPGATAVSNPVTNIAVGTDNARLGGPTGSANAATGKAISAGLLSGAVAFAGLLAL